MCKKLFGLGLACMAMVERIGEYILVPAGEAGRYDLYRGGRQVASTGLVRGHFIVEVPEIGGERIFDTEAVPCDIRLADIASAVAEFYGKENDVHCWN